MQVEVVTGKALQPYLDALAELRIRVFRDWPYLYAGDPAYERRYLQKFADCAESIMVLARDQERIVGASSGLPLSAEGSELREPFEQAGYPVAEVFYCGESVLLPEYRGHGLGHRFFDEREAHARRLGYSLICFAAVERPADHPRRPPDYVPLDAFWNRRGYRQQPQLRTSFPWRDLDEATETPKPMVFWTRRL